MNCIEKVRDYVEARRLIEPGSKVVVAVSGGPDSMALLSILFELSGKTFFDIAVAHFEHGIRPEASREKALVERGAKKLGVPFFIGAGDVPAEARRVKKGIEETARLMRLRFLEETARSWNASAVALGHTANDQVETILHHIIRGAGLRGLQGIPARRGIFIHPLLDCRRDELRDFLRRRGVTYAIDKSNFDERLLRNRIRNGLLPYLRREFNPAIDEATLRLAENVSEGWASLEEPLRGLVSSSKRGNEIRIPLAKLATLSDFQIYILIDLMLRTRLGVFQDVEKKHFDAMKRLIRSGRSGRRIQFPHEITASREHSSVILRRAHFDAAPPGEAIVPDAGTYILPGWNLSVTAERLGAAPADPRAKPSEAYFAALQFPLRVRPWKPGDRIVPFGMRGRKKLSDLFIDRKVPLSRRNRIPVFEDAKGVFWVPGVVTGERTRIVSGTRRVVRLKLFRLGGK